MMAAKSDKQRQKESRARKRENKDWVRLDIWVHKTRVPEARKEEKRLQKPKRGKS